MEREIFVDAGAWIAASDTRGKYHKPASEHYKRLLDEDWILVTTKLLAADAYIIIGRTGGNEQG